MEQAVHACLIVDDSPANATYLARLQQLALGYDPEDGHKSAARWRDLAPSSLLRPHQARAFADLIEEFGIRGKYSFLPCPAGLGRIDRSVRGYENAELQELIAIHRERIAPRMDITPEVLTHTMVYDPESGALLPHAESAWLSHLCATRNLEPLIRYLTHAFTILRNAGLPAHGVTIGGLTDVSGIGKGRSLNNGDDRDVLCQALLQVERGFAPDLRSTFTFTGARPIHEQSRIRHVPEVIYRDAGGMQVYELYCVGRDPFWDVLHGPGDVFDQTVDAMISRDLSAGWMVREAEAGNLVVFTFFSAASSN